MRPRINAASGAGIGLALAVTSLAAVGGGHGTQAPLQISGAPFSAFGTNAALAGALIVWTGIGIAVTRGQYSLTRVFLVVHYLAAIWEVVKNNDLMYLRDGPAPLWFVSVVWLIVYCCGQVAIWRTLIDRTSRNKMA